MDFFEHLDTSIEVFFECEVLGNDLSTAYTKQGFLGPFREPVDGTAVDQGWEHPQSGPEDLSKWTHGNDHVNVSLHLAKVALEHVHLRDLKILLHTEQLSDLEDRLKVLILIEIWHITRVEDVVNILKHLLVHNLSVDEEEGGGLVLDSCLHQGLLYVLTPVLHVIALDDLNLEELIVSHEGGEP